MLIRAISYNHCLNLRFLVCSEFAITRTHIKKNKNKKKQIIISYLERINLLLLVLFWNLNSNSNLNFIIIIVKDLDIIRITEFKVIIGFILLLSLWRFIHPYFVLKPIYGSLVL